MATSAAEHLGRVEELIKKHSIQTVVMGAVDIDGLWRGKRVPAGYFLEGVCEKGSNICKIVFGWDVEDEIIPGLDYANWEQGYPDFTMVPDLSTFAVMPWQPNTASVICDFVELDGTPVAISPRQVLRNVLDRAAGMGYQVRVGYELEFYLFRESADSVRAKDFVGLVPATPGIHTYSLFRLASVAPVINDMVRHMSDYGIRLEAANTEYGSGQFEINMHHDTALAAADHVVMYKEGVCGGVGIAAIQGARLAGARRTVAVDAVPAKLDLARRFGATDAVLADADPATTARRLRALMPEGFQHAIEAVGRPQTAELAFEVLAPAGTATILGLMPEGERLSISADALVYGDRVLQGAYMGANRFLADVATFVDHYRAGRLDLDAMVTAQLPFTEINEGFAAMADPRTIRIVLGPPGPR